MAFYQKLEKFSSAKITNVLLRYTNLIFSLLYFFVVKGGTLKCCDTNTSDFPYVPL